MTRSTVKTKSTAYVTVKVKVRCGQWEPSCSQAQVADAASREAANAVRNVIGHSHNMTVISADVVQIVTELERTA